jgi:hypothetical protein
MSRSGEDAIAPETKKAPSRTKGLFSDGRDLVAGARNALELMLTAKLD